MVAPPQDNAGGAPGMPRPTEGVPFLMCAPTEGQRLERANRRRSVGALCQLSSSSFSTAINASVGIWTVPKLRIFFLPSFCFSSSFFFRVMSPP